MNVAGNTLGPMPAKSRHLPAKLDRSLKRDQRYMRRALKEARKGVGRTSPNPAVGAVIVGADKILSVGYHRGAGFPHAEIEAIRAVAKSSKCRGATIYITLEPCSTHGRTPPCTDAIIQAGFRRVVFGATDPNPRHAGRAEKILQSAGVAVTSGILSQECADLNRAFNHWITTGKPWVVAKYASSLDGRLTRRPGEPTWLTRPAARRHAQALRARVDAILVGAATVRADNPQLTVRGIRGARQPWRVVITRSGRLPKSARLFTDAHRARTLVFRKKSLRTVLRDLGARDVLSVLIEGGGDVLGQAFDHGLVDEVQCYFAPLLVGGPIPAVGGRGVPSNEARVRLERPRYEKVGPDVCLHAYVSRATP